MRDDLRAAVLADPDDDAARLVCADALLARGDPRGELIAVQCAMARLDEHDPAWVALRRRELALLAAHRAGWAPAGLDPGFRRGFAARVAGAPDQLLAHAGWLAVEPVEEVSLRGTAGLGALIDRGLLRRVRRLRLDHAGGAHELDRLLDADLPALRDLMVNGFPDDALRALIDAPPVRRLRALAVHGRPGPDALAAIAGADLPALEALYIEDAGTGALPPPRMPSLRRLELWWLRAGDAELAAYLRALPVLDELRLHGFPLEPLTCEAFAGANLRGLRALTVELPDRDWARAVAALPGLEELDAHCYASGLVAVLATGRWPLRSLGLVGDLDPAGLAAIGASGWPLRRLALTHPRDGHGAALATGPAFRGLTRLTWTSRADEVAAAMAGDWPVLHRLELWIDALGDAGAAAIASARAPALCEVQAWRATPDGEAILAGRFGAGFHRP